MAHGYSVHESDAQGAERGAKAPRRSVNGATPYHGLSEQGEALAHFDTSPRRTRKGRTTFTVTGRHQRRMTGAHPLLPDSLPDWESGTTVDPDTGIRSGADLVALADAWVRIHHPEVLSERHYGTAECTCSDLTVRAIVLDREQGFQPVWEDGAYVTAEVPVRACHCSDFPALLGTDLGLSWQDMTPDPRRTVAYRGRAKARRNARERAARARERVATVCPWQDETDTLSAVLSATDEPVVTVETFPGVTVVIRRTVGGRLNVRMTRGDESIRFTARTAGAIARRVVA